jgi:hypothetical protein
MIGQAEGTRAGAGYAERHGVRGQAEKTRAGAGYAERHGVRGQAQDLPLQQHWVVERIMV